MINYLPKLPTLPLLAAKCFYGPRIISPSSPFIKPLNLANQIMCHLVLVRRPPPAERDRRLWRRECVSSLFLFSSPEPQRTRGLWLHRIIKSEILGLLMASICSSRSVNNVSKGGLCIKKFATPKFRDIDTSRGAD